jgi:hypothetical protein
VLPLKHGTDLDMQLYQKPPNSGQLREAVAHFTDGTELDMKLSLSSSRAYGLWSPASQLSQT